MYNSLHYTYNLYIVMYYRNIWSLWGKNMTNPEEVVSKRWHNLFFTFYSPAIFSFAYDAFF